VFVTGGRRFVLERFEATVHLATRKKHTVQFIWSMSIFNFVKFFLKQTPSKPDIIVLSSTGS
jgi:hypothetical protein